MPVPGPRTQFGPVPGYDNPEGSTPDFFHRIFHRPVLYPGQTPGTMVVLLQAFTLAPGQVRRMWQQAINEVRPAEPYDVVSMAPAPGRPIARPPKVGVTRALRYMASSRYLGVGDSLTDWGAHTIVNPQHINPTPTVGAGNTRGNPTVRNRLTSFGSRAPVLNPEQVPAAIDQSGS